MPGHYERLSYLDNSFLALESRSTHMHVAGIAVFAAAPLRTEGGGIDTDAIRMLVESKLHMIPRYRQRLARVPIEKHPVWVDDEHFNIEYHVRHYSLPRPGSFDQLRSLVGIIMSQQLDRSKPLWEFNIVEGLEDDQFAIISKIHHCMIDGIAGVDLMAVLLNLAPSADIDDPVPYVARRAPSGNELLVRETARRTGKTLAAMRSVRQLSDDASQLVRDGAHRARAAGYSLASGWLTSASDTALNGKVGPNRLFGTLETPLAQIKDVKNSAGGSVNDVVLATVAGGVRRFLMEDRDYDVAGLDFRAMAPVSVRSQDQRGTLGNQVAMWLVSLPITEPDPLRRLEAVKAATERLKETNQALGAATLVRLSAGAPATLVSMASRLATGVRPFNMTVTNVPGPQFPLYLLGSQMLASYALVPLWQAHGVGVALFSYAGSVYWGFNADYDIVPDVDAFVEATRLSFAELHEAAMSGKPPPKKRPKSRPPLGKTPAQKAKPAASKGKAEN
ncbi:MAG: wax ester/triacylglycerol synthase family O-acyltransferase [Acidimicrobiia bacterium]|nr:wax ester/triacylglycerol synthase family O-acyltransferase [Acidimicrobiia bacterium]